MSVVIAGTAVPGRYLRSMPMSAKELAALAPRLKGWRLVGGPAAGTAAAEGFDFRIRRDLAASLYDGMSGREVGERLRTLDEWNRWMLLGADVVTGHQDFPLPLIAEIESYRGCHRFSTGGCSFCVEPSKGRPLMRSPDDIVAEAARLRELGVRNVRVGGQTCIVSYGADPDSPVPVPNPEAVDDLFEGLRSLGFDVLHVDNANAAVLSSHPDESAQVLETLASKCTSGNVLALGLESADPRVFAENNLNSTAEQVLDAVRMVNRIGGFRGPNGMPRLLPGINLVCGLDGETPETYAMDLDLLGRIRDEGLSVRRINIRQVVPSRREFGTRVDRGRFRAFKEEVRADVDRVMLERVAPYGTVLRDVYMEVRDGNTTFGRQIGSYPLLVGVPYRVDLERFRDVYVTGWGFRSVTGVTFPFDVNSMPMSALEALPGIGRRRAQRIAAERPFDGFDDFAEAVGDPSVVDALRDVVVFGRPAQRYLRPPSWRGMDSERVAKFPFLEESREFVEASGADIPGLMTSDLYAPARERGLGRVMDALERSEVSYVPMVGASEYGRLMEVLSYPYARMLVSAVGDRFLTKRYALAEAVRMNGILAGEDRDVVVQVSGELRVPSSADVDGMMNMHFSDYLRLASRLKSVDWKLVNSDIRDGTVALPKDKFSRLMQNALQDKIESELPLMTPPEFVRSLEPDVLKVQERLAEAKARFSPTGGEGMRMEFVPPCIAHIMDMSRQGLNLPHSARFSLVTFLNLLGLSYEEIIAVFAESPDFDESKSEYQIKHITGELNGGEGYTTPECATMKTNGLCFNPDTLCQQEWMNHPLTYYRVKSRPRDPQGQARDRPE